MAKIATPSDEHSSGLVPVAILLAALACVGFAAAFYEEMRQASVIGASIIVAAWFLFYAQRIGSLWSAASRERRQVRASLNILDEMEPRLDDMAREGNSRTQSPRPGASSGR